MSEASHAPGDPLRITEGISHINAKLNVVRGGIDNVIAGLVNKEKARKIEAIDLSGIPDSIRAMLGRKDEPGKIIDNKDALVEFTGQRATFVRGGRNDVVVVDQRIAEPFIRGAEVSEFQYVTIPGTTESNGTVYIAVPREQKPTGEAGDLMAIQAKDVKELAMEKALHDLPMGADYSQRIKATIAKTPNEILELVVHNDSSASAAIRGEKLVVANKKDMDRLRSALADLANGAFGYTTDESLDAYILEMPKGYGEQYIIGAMARNLKVSVHQQTVTIEVPKHSQNTETK